MAFPWDFPWEFPARGSKIPSSSRLSRAAAAPGGTHGLPRGSLQRRERMFSMKHGVRVILLIMGLLTRCFQWLITRLIMGLLTLLSGWW